MWNKLHLDRLPGLKFMRTLWLCAVSGGPYTYISRSGKCPIVKSLDLTSAHSSLQISPDEFDAVAVELANTLDFYKIPPTERQEVLAVFSAHKNEVITGYNVAHNL